MIHNITADKEFCFYCYQAHYKTFDSLKVFIEQDNYHIKLNQILRHVKICFNAVSVFNFIVVYLVFGGPMLITHISLLSDLLVFISMFVENQFHVLTFEAAVLLVAVFTWAKSLYVIMVCIIEVGRKKIQ